MAAIRIKSQWFRADAPRSAQQTASAMAAIAWRVAQNMLRQMRAAQFDVEVGPQYFAFTREVLVFFVQVLERMVFARLSESARAEFITALVRRLAQVLQDNEDSLLGQPAPGEPGHYHQFIDLFNELADHYAEFGYDQQGPDFAFVRYLGYRIEALMPQKDQRWVVEQIMASEVPQALALLQRALDNVLCTEMRAPRTGPAAPGGD